MDFEQILEAIEKLSVLELNELVNQLEQKKWKLLKQLKI